MDELQSRFTSGPINMKITGHSFKKETLDIDKQVSVASNPKVIDQNQSKN